MQLDPSIILGAKPAQFESPANQLAKLLQVQEMQQMGRAREMQMQDAQEAKASKNRLTSLLSQYGDAQDLPEQLTKGGFIDQANTVRKNRTEAQNAKTATDKQGLELVTKRLEIAGQAFGHVRANPTLENAVSVINFLGQNGIYTPEQVQQYTQLVQSDPSPAKIAQLADMNFRSVLSAQQQLPKIETRDTGGAVQTFKVDPVTGQQSTVASVAKTQSPDSIATDRREAGTGGANKPPMGYRWTASGDLEPIPGGPGDARMTELGDKRRATEEAKSAKVASIDAQIGVIDKALTHPGRETATGLSGSLDPRNYIPGTNATDFRAVLDQIGGAAFLQAFESLKGGGAITEVEGKKATDAIARLNRAQSDTEFVQALNDLRAVMKIGRDKLAGGSTAGAQPAANRPKPALADIFK